MTRLTTAVLCLLIPAAAAAAQLPAPVPVPPPAPQAPAAAPPAPAPPPAAPAFPAPPALKLPMANLESLIRDVEAQALELGGTVSAPELETQLEDLRGQLADSAAVRALADQTRAMAQAGADQTLEEKQRAAEQARQAAEQARQAAAQQRDLSQLDQIKIAQGRGPIIGSPGVRVGAEDALYTSALSLLSGRQFDRAITQFDQVVARKNAHADGALYWKAFAQWKLGNTDAAVSTIAALRRDYPQSRYLNDAKVLEADVRKTAGQPVNLDAASADEDIKILAIQAIQKSEPEKAVPLLEGVLTASNSLNVKKRAIYVLALSDDARAHEVLLRYAKGAGNPDLQAEAIRYLASRNDKRTSSAELREIYESTQDPAVKRAVIDAYRVSGDAGAIKGIFVNDAQPLELRQAALRNLNGLAAPQDLWALYQKEPDSALRMQMVGIFVSMGAVDQITQAARSDKDAAVRRRAIQALGAMKTEQTGTTLVDLYSNEQDVETRRAIISALGAQKNPDALVALGRKETNPDLKREIVRRLSDMAATNKTAEGYMMDLLK